jgi:ankyrin repeat protein
VDLLLDHGANPFDQQVLYNLHFHGSVTWFLERVHAHTVGTPLHDEWSKPDWPMFDMGSYGCGARYLLDIAIRKNDVALARWLLEHGANPESPTHPPFPDRTLYEEAKRRGCDEIAHLLAFHGATVRDVVLSDEESLARACMSLDGDRVAEHFRRNARLKNSPHALFAMTRQNNADAALVLMECGVSPDVEDRHRQRALHIAGYTDAVSVAEQLIQRGAAIDPVEGLWQNTPLDCAVYNGSHRMVALLSEISSDVWNLAFLGRVDRLREVLLRKPSLALSTNNNGATPLMRLVDDETQATAVAQLLIECGADPSARRKDGRTAADIAEHRGMRAVARFLRSAERRSGGPNARR